MGPFFFLKNGIPPPSQSHDPSQIVTFMKVFYKHCFSFHDCGKNKLLQKALIFMDQPGINDYKHGFLHGKCIFETSHLVPEVVETVKSSIGKTYQRSCRWNCNVSEILPLGCFLGYFLIGLRTIQLENADATRDWICHWSFTVITFGKQFWSCVWDTLMLTYITIKRSRLFSIAVVCIDLLRKS